MRHSGSGDPDRIPGWCRARGPPARHCCRSASLVPAHPGGRREHPGRRPRARTRRSPHAGTGARAWGRAGRSRIAGLTGRIKQHLAASVSLNVACRRDGDRPTLRGMFSVTEAQAAAIKTAFEQEGELSAAIEVRRLFPGITTNQEARSCARTIAGWTAPAAVPQRAEHAKVVKLRPRRT